MFRWNDYRDSTQLANTDCYTESIMDGGVQYKL